MRYRKAVLLPLVAVFLLVTTVPAMAWDGWSNWKDIIEVERDHPWQDENQDPGSISRVVPPVVVTPVAISFSFDLPSWLCKLVFHARQDTPIEVKAVTCSRKGGNGRIHVSGRNYLR